VPADEQRTFRFATQSGPQIACCIHVLFDREFAELFAQPRSRFHPDFRECDTLCAVFVGGKAAEFLQFGDRPFWIQAHGDIFIADSAKPAD
jgi:hypothetical protein